MYTPLTWSTIILTLLAVVHGLGRTASAQCSAQEATKLDLNKVIERRLGGTECHQYRVNIAGGHFVHLRVVQRGVDVVLKFYAPDGRELLRVDTPNGISGPETVDFIAELAGEYRLAVTPLEKSAPAGSYKVLLAESRRERRGDAARVKRQQTLITATEKEDRVLELMAKGQQVDAESLLHEAVRLRRSVSGQPYLSRPLHMLALLYEAQGKNEQALRAFEDALPELEKAEGRESANVGIALYKIGGYHLTQNNPARAEPSLRRAVEIMGLPGRAPSDYLMYGHQTLGYLYSSQKRFAEAETQYQRALETAAKLRRTSESADSAQLLSELGGVYMAREDYPRAAETFRKALAVCEKVKPDPQLTAGVLLNFAMARFAESRAAHGRGSYDEAEAKNLEAMELLKRIPEDIVESVKTQYATTRVMMLSGLGEIHAARKDVKRKDSAAASQRFREALAICESAALSAEITANVLTKLGSALHDADEYPQAEVALHRAVKLYQSIKAPQENLLMPYYLLGQIELSLQNHTLAELHLTEARRIAAANPHQVPKIDTHLGELYTKTGDFVRAEEHLRRTLTYHEKNDANSFDVANACRSVAKMYEAKGDFNRAESFYSRAIGIYRKKIPARGPAIAEHISLLIPLGDLGSIYIKRGDYQRAEQVLDELRGIAELAKAEQYPIGLQFSFFATAYTMRGRFDQAEVLLREALSRVKMEEFETASILEQLGWLYTLKADYARAEDYLKQALAIRERDGKDSPKLRFTLFYLAELYRQQGRHNLAIEQADRHLAIHEKHYGPDHYFIADKLRFSAQIHLTASNYGHAEALARRMLEINEKHFGPESVEAAEALQNICLLYAAKLDFPNMRPSRERAVAILEKKYREKTLGIFDASSLVGLYLISLNQEEMNKGIRLLLETSARDENEGSMFTVKFMGKIQLAQLYGMLGDFPNAEQAYREAVSIAEQSSGRDSPAVVQPLKLMADFYFNKADFAEAERLYERVLKLQTQLFGPAHPGLSDTLLSIGSFDRAKGDYVKPEGSWLRALEIRKAAFGPASQQALEVQGTLADLYRDRGEYDRAERLYLETLAVAEKSTGLSSMPVFNVQHGLGVLYRIKEDYGRAETHFQKAQDIIKAAYGPSTLFSMMSLIIPARMYLQRGDYLKAQTLFKQVLSLRSNSVSWNDLSDSFLRISLGETYRYQGNYAEAASLAQQALTLREGMLGHDHPDTILALDSLADTRQAQGEFREAVRLRTLAAERGEKNITRFIASGSERQKSQLLATFARGTDAIISLHLTAAPTNPDARRLALTTILRRKGRALDAFSDQLAALRRNATAEDRVLLDQLAAASTRWTNLVFRSSAQAEAAPQPNAPRNFEREISNLEEEVQRLEAALSARSAQFRTQTQSVNLEAVRAALPAEAVLVEFVAYRPYNPSAAASKDRFGPTRYAAYVLTRQDEIGFVDLGEAAPVDELALRWRSLLGKRADQKQVKRVGGALYQRLFAPVRKLLGNRRRLLLVPDGNLNLVQFAALTDESGSYLIENYDISYLTSGRELLRFREQLPSESADMVIANPAFDLTRPEVKCPPVTGLAPPPQYVFAGRCFNSLPGTAREADALALLLPGAQLKTGAEATEAAVKGAARPRRLHLATHGFFWPDEPAPNAAPGADQAVRNGAQPFNPMIRSGLILAGVKQGTSGAGEDGVLTAQEVAGLNLLGTELVVLSACETALGDAQNGQGVYGLRRALVLAGSETQIMSLWRVSDDSTRALMVAYYSRLQAGEGRAAALREVQLAMLRGESPTAPVRSGRRETHDTVADAPKDYRHPYYWAGFIPSGDWRSLNGEEK